MTQTFKVTGMSCGHCETQVKNALLTHTDVTDVKVSKDTESAIIESNTPIEFETLKKTFEEFEGMFEISNMP